MKRRLSTLKWWKLTHKLYEWFLKNIFLKINANSFFFSYWFFFVLWMKNFKKKKKKEEMKIEYFIIKEIILSLH